MPAQSSSLLSNPAIAAFVGAIVGGVFSFFSTFYFNSRQSQVKNERLRRALATEIASLKIEQLKIAVKSMQSQGTIQDFIGDHLIGLAEVQLGEVSEQVGDDAEQTLDEIVQDVIAKAAPEAFGKVELYLDTPVYENNTDKIGLLESDSIEQLIDFYRFLDITRDELHRVVETANEKDYSRLESRLQTLYNNLDELESMRDDTLSKINVNSANPSKREDLESEVIEDEEQEQNRGKLESEGTD